MPHRPARARTLVALTADEFDRCWRALNLGQPPEPFAHLTGRRPVGPVQIEPRLRDLLTVLATSRQELHATLRQDPGHRIMAAAVGDEGVLAVGEGDKITLTRIFGKALTRTIVTAVPPLRGGPGRSVSLPSAVFDAACADGEDLAARLVERRIGQADAAMIGEMLSGVVGGGQFTSAVRDGANRRKRGGHAVAFVDTDHGRYLIEQRATYNGPAWTTIAPGGIARLTNQVGRLLTDTAR
ncbi:ESX secretion-associated protein EspG [Allokutzneria sp. A3M-2-11 16]|uniref:ESX secretion-associated protein EspG n=1 Tax=Allokutzneria sp. A3M-2-11 16 TaxID=2962043 RepID=UPI0020B72494|nr:ESX secretion-associated protein EspG [Allokutzneria sp. A3M-2-11 16]MCP3798532.1 ESX secretion-associated protein EspG [Allokutzneria sp. A3M-2-11 16]